MLDEISILNGSRNRKYMWTDEACDKWHKEQANKLRDTFGIKIGTAGVSRIVVEKVLIPNNIQLTSLFTIKKRIRLRKHG